MFLLKRWLREWKPIHLCWWFEKHDLPIPPYFIGGTAATDQAYWKIGDNDNSNADSCSFDALDTPRTGQAKTSPFMVRIQVVETTGSYATGNKNWQLYYNDSDNPATAVLVGDALGGNIKCEPVTGQPTDGANLTGSIVVYDNSPSYTWQDGEYDDGDAATDKLALGADGYTDFQFCVQFTANAADNTSYYFFVRYDDSALDAHTAGGAQVETVAGVTQINFSSTLNLTTLTSDPIMFREITFKDTLNITTLTSNLSMLINVDFASTLPITTLTSDPILSLGAIIDFASTLAITTLTSDVKLGLLTNFASSLGVTSLTSDPKMLLNINLKGSIDITTLTSSPSLFRIITFSGNVNITTLTSAPTLSVVTLVNFASVLNLTTLTSDAKLALLTNFASSLNITTTTSALKMLLDINFSGTLNITTLTSTPELSGLTLDFSSSLNITTLTSDPIMFKSITFSDTLNITTLTSDPILGGIIAVIDFSGNITITTLTSLPTLSGLGTIAYIYRWNGTTWDEIVWG